MQVEPYAGANEPLNLSQTVNLMCHEIVPLALCLVQL